MKHRLLRYGLLLCLGSLLIWCSACSRQPEPTPALTGVAASPAAIANAQAWFRRQAPAAARAGKPGTAARDGDDGQPAIDWTQAILLDEHLVAPFADSTHTFNKSPKYGYRFLVVGMTADSAYAGRIVELITPEQPASPDAAATVALAAAKPLLDGQQPGPLADFTGSLLAYSPAYQYETGLAYQDGAVQPVQMRLEIPPPGMCYDYYLVGYDNTGTMVVHELINSVCNDPPAGGWGGTPGSGGGGGGSGPTTGPSTSPTPALNPRNVYLFDGIKPLGEFPDICSGAQGLWNLGVSHNNAETAGVITADGKFLIVAIVGQIGGSFGGLYHFDDGSAAGVDYYQWPTSQGSPTQTYQGMVTRAGHYFIPIVATVHTHTPCLSDGTDGISNMTLSPGDQSLAARFLTLNHNIIGCNAVGTFSNASTSPVVTQTGPLSSTCSSIQ